ncbi:riboflavin synthase [Cloacibacillus sp. An23]|uniref:riboflavin synthase n=1 Tax=Cloacibacillus sp. An23 TaxID=1965591 RepID=UPI000B3A75AF|nr:riboflavin synthase [Cloacibacillus sp. An23]OUO94614.1 riboflavin synthase [Cloacibacillus sp. An23]
MFTGLIETVGSITAITPLGDVTELTIRAPEIAPELRRGDSVAVSGACQTVTFIDASSFKVQMMPETLKRTKLGVLRTGSRVNLERAMRLDTRVDGHLVAGHVDGTATVTRVDELEQTKKIYFSAGAELLGEIVEKGSVTVDGVSLTVIDAEPDFFSVGVIPTTLADTTLGSLRAGDVVNIETDMIGKYVKKFVEAALGEKKEGGKMKNSLTWDKLSEYGWN